MMLKPAYRLTVDGADITDRVRPRLGALTITSQRAGHADQLDLVLADTDGRLEIPRRKAVIAVSIGFAAEGIGLQGSFVVDEAEHSGPPDTITVRARSAPMAGDFRVRKERSWRGVTLGHVVAVIAGEHSLMPRVAPSLVSLAVDLDQSESDMAFLRRLGRRWDAVATVKDGRLLFAPMGAGRTVSGTPLPALTIRPSVGDRHRYHTAERDAYTGVRARWHDLGSAQSRTVLAGTSERIKVLRADFASREDAQREAAAELARVRRGAATFGVDFAVGRLDVMPDMPVNLQGWKPDIDAEAWIVTQVVQRLDGESALTTSLELETRATASEAAAKDEGEGTGET